MRRARLAFAWAAAASLLAACAGGDGPSGPVTPIAPENVFVSPSGEPFHGAPQGPYASALWFAKVDADRDGRVSRAEFMADAMRAFRRYDADGNGVIDGIEVAAYEDHIAPEIAPRIGALRAGEGEDASLFGGRGRSPQDGGERRRTRVTASDRQLQGAGFYGMLDEPEPVSAADADLDGKVTREEWQARSERRFDELANGAVALTLAALPKPAMQVLLERRRAREARRKP